MICGESGSGKTTVVKELCKRFKIKELQSYTTRPKRSDDESGHIFISKLEFDKLSNKVAYTKFDKYEYCATCDQVNESDVLTIDPKGIEFFSNNYKGTKRYLVIYIYVEPEKRKQRMIIRGDKINDIENRIKHDKIAFKNVSQIADYTVANETIEKCLLDIWKYISNIN